MTDEKTAQDYKRKGFSNPLGYGRNPGLLVIDYVTGFTDPACDLGADYDREIDATCRLLEVAREKNVQIVFTTVQFDKGMTDAGWFVKKVPSLKNLGTGSPWTGLDPRLRVEPGPSEHVVNKKYASAFFGTNVASLFTSTGCDTVIITGVTTSGCVRASTVDALQNGFPAHRGRRRGRRPRRGSPSGEPFRHERQIRGRGRFGERTRLSARPVTGRGGARQQPHGRRLTPAGAGRQPPRTANHTDGET